MTMIWCDLETTGLSEHEDKILEVGIVITTDDLMVCAAHDWVVKPKSMPTMNERVLEMHTNNGLLTEVEENGWDTGDVENAVIMFLRDNVSTDENWTLAGSSIHFDRKFLSAYMTDLEECLHYRMIDVSTIKELVNRWNPNAKYDTDHHPEHRTIPDLYDSIAELKYYRTLMCM